MANSTGAALIRSNFVKKELKPLNQVIHQFGKQPARFDVSKASVQKLMIFYFPNSSIDN